MFTQSVNTETGSLTEIKTEATTMPNKSPAQYTLTKRLIIAKPKPKDAKCILQKNKHCYALIHRTPEDSPVKLKNLAIPALRFSAAAVFLAFSGQAFATCSPDAYLGSVCMTAANFCPGGTVPAKGQTLSISANAALYSLLGTTYGGNGSTEFGIPDLQGRVPVGDGQGANPALALVTQGQKNGTESQTLSILNMPMHNHGAVLTSSDGDRTVSVFSNGSGSIIAKASTVVIPGAASAVDPAANTNYYLTGVTSAANGPLTTTAPDTDAKKNATLIGTTVTVDTSNYQPPINTTATIKGVPTGVTIGVTGGSQPFSIIPPRLALKFCVVTQGTYPPRPD